MKTKSERDQNKQKSCGVMSSGELNKSEKLRMKAKDNDDDRLEYERSCTGIKKLASRLKLVNKGSVHGSTLLSNKQNTSKSARKNTRNPKTYK
mmetsp:Transcript_15878/g.17723  ORF Transcript_15878/g.17723 Transcript_15878/m.17723 type:complete len:93 (+) Transcript_15878:100-378(+)